MLFFKSFYFSAQLIYCHFFWFFLYVFYFRLFFKGQGYIIGFEIDLIKIKMVVGIGLFLGAVVECESDFFATRNVLKHCRFDHVDIFKYSETNASPSRQLVPKVPSEVILQRSRDLKESLTGCFKVIV